MARPIKNTVDYFPHIVNHGKTIFILESKFGNDGYAFWFKLLELLGSSHNHVYDYGNLSDWEFLLAKTKVSEEKAHEILKTLADVGAIDSELLEKKMIWCENFIKGIEVVYKSRRQETPQRPVISEKHNIEGLEKIREQTKLRVRKFREAKKCNVTEIEDDSPKNQLLVVETPPQDSFYQEKPPAGVVSTGNNPHTIVEDTIVEESKEDIKERESQAPSIKKEKEIKKEVDPLEFNFEDKCWYGLDDWRIKMFSGKYPNLNINYLLQDIYKGKFLSDSLRYQKEIAIAGGVEKLVWTWLGQDEKFRKRKEAKFDMPIKAKGD